MTDEWPDLVPLVCGDCGTTILYYPGRPGAAMDIRVGAKLYDDIARAQQAHVCEEGVPDE